MESTSEDHKTVLNEDLTLLERFRAVEIENILLDSLLFNKHSLDDRLQIACRSFEVRSKFARRFVCRSLENRSICEIRQDRALSGRGPFEYGQFIQMISLVLTCLFLNLVSLIWLPEPLRIALVCRSCLNGREVFV